MGYESYDHDLLCGTYNVYSREAQMSLFALLCIREMYAKIDIKLDENYRAKFVRIGWLANG